jgi:hypothetical protein
MQESGGIEFGENIDLIRGVELQNGLQTTSRKQTATLLLFGLVFGFLIVIMSIASATLNNVNELQQSERSRSSAPSEALGLPGYELMTWQDVTDQAAGKSVNFWTYYDSTTFSGGLYIWLTGLHF